MQTNPRKSLLRWSEFRKGSPKIPYEVISKEPSSLPAVEIIRTEGKASTSFLQRKLQIGYNRAARIIDAMEADGIVSKANHVGKREVIK